MPSSSVVAAALLLVVFVVDCRAQQVQTSAVDDVVAKEQAAAGGGQQTATTSAPAEEERPSWGVIDATGSGVVVHRSDKAELAIGAYALVRYINQLPAELQFTDHLGRVHDIDTRNDIQFHRVRTNIQMMHVDRSPVGSVFGFYVGGQKGPTVSVATSFYF